METMLRHWALLRAVPRQPRKLDARGLTERLENQGFRVSKRTVERDLVKLATIFPLISDEAPMGRGWSWPREAEPFDVPGMDPETALTLRILERFASHLLPRSVLRHLDPQFDRARTTLDSLEPETGPGAWPGRVRVLSRSIDLQPPEVAPEVIEVVYRALLEGRRFEADYRSRAAGGELKTYTVNPLGLVFRDHVAYLVCTLWDYEDIRQLVLHRIDRAELWEESRAEPRDFDLDKYISAGHFQVVEGDAHVALIARFAPEAAYHLFETPLAGNQVLSELDNGWVELHASVPDTAQLRWWLLGFGCGVEVIGPSSLREEFVQQVTTLFEIYGAPG